jgi:hypothetical protein
MHIPILSNTYSERAKDVFLLALIGLAVTACATMQSIDPVQTPPARFQGDTTASVEFLAAERIMPRCLERGAAVLANACADTRLITITNPCAYQGESYARRLCHEIGHVNGWDAGHRNIPLASDSPQAKALAGS